MDKLLALRASAGTGKTFSLNVRFLSLLFLGAKSSNIIALTFTKKAANEMKTRIFSTLENLENCEKELEQICKTTNKSKEEILDLKKQVLQDFLRSNLHIETIDAFFGKILRKFSLHLGLMPDFQSTDINHNGKLEELFIKEALKDKNTLNALVKFMVHEQKKLPNVFDFFISLYEKSKELDFDLYPSNSHLDGKPLLLKAKEIALFLQDKGASKRAIGMFDVDDVDKLVSKTFWSKISLDYSTFKKVYEPNLDKMFFELKDLYKDYCKAKEAYVLGEIFRLFKLYESVKLRLSIQTNELSFSDITFLVYKLLQGAISREFLYFRLDGQIDHLLIDEFQDTNVVQFDILKPIVEEISSGKGVRGDKSFFYVGDTKQSIYRFRGGSSELFEAVAKEFHIKTLPLKVNFRSYGFLVDFVSEVFGRFFPELKEQETDVKNQNKGYVEVKTSDDLFEELKKSLQNLFEHGVSEDDIAVLVRTNDEANLAKEELASWDKALNVSIESTKKITDTIEVKALIEFLKFNYFGFRISEKNTLVLLGKSFEEDLSARLSNLDKTPEKILIEAVDLLKIDGTNEDVLAFIEIASSYAHIGDLLFDLDRITQSSKTSEQMGIKVLTIHKSKGLEFEHVIVLDKQLSKKGGTFIYEYENERLSKLHLRIKNREFVDEQYKNALQKEEILKDIDAKNALYVAFTRAKKSLIILKNASKLGMDFLDLKDRQIGKMEPSQKHEEKKNLHRFTYPVPYGLQSSQAQEEDKEYNIKSIYFGLALHYLLEISSDFTKEALKVALVGVKNRFGEFVEMDLLYKRALNLVQNKQFLSLIKGGKLKKEQPILYKGERKQLDLLVEFDNKYVIIDYKTSENIYDEHIKQVSLYKKALSSFSKKKVQAWLFYVKRNGVDALEVDK